MAEAPAPISTSSDEARWLLAWGLPSGLVPPTGRFDTDRYAALADEARRQRIEGLLWTAIVDGTLDVDDRVRARAGRDELAAVRGRMDYEARVAELLERFDSAGIEVRILKGLALARLDYDDELHRPTSDLDLAVRPDQIDAAVAMLVDLGGYWEDPEPAPGWLRRVAKGATVHLGGHSLEVDLHRILVWGPLGVRLDPAELWNQGRAFDIGGVQRIGLGREEMLLHVCAHLLILGVPRPAGVRDVAQILCNPALDVPRLVRLARRWGAESLLAVAIRFAERELELTPGAHPLEDWAARYEVSRRDRLWLRAGATHDRVYGVEQLGVLVELGHGRRPGRWAARATLLRANLWPAPGTYPSAVTRLARLTRRWRMGGLLGRRRP